MSPIPFSAPIKPLYRPLLLAALLGVLAGCGDETARESEGAPSPSRGQASNFRAEPWPTTNDGYLEVSPEDMKWLIVSRMKPQNDTYLAENFIPGYTTEPDPVAQESMRDDHLPVIRERLKALEKKTFFQMATVSNKSLLGKVSGSSDKDEINPNPAVLNYLSEGSYFPINLPQCQGGEGISSGKQVIGAQNYYIHEWGSSRTETACQLKIQDPTQKSRVSKGISNGTLQTRHVQYFRLGQASESNPGPEMQIHHTTLGLYEATHPYADDKGYVEVLNQTLSSPQPL